MTTMQGPIPYVRKEKRPVEALTITLENAPISLEDAYADVARALTTSGWAIGGWKIGGSNHITSDVFGVDVPYYGALLNEEILLTSEGRPCPGFPLMEWKGEVEFALRLAADGQGYDAWCIALEMPSSPLTNLPAAGVAALVADRCGAGALLLGTVQEGMLPDLEGRSLCLVVDGKEIDCADVGALTAHPADILTQTVDLMNAQGSSPEPGQWFATGGVTLCHSLPPKGHVIATLSGTSMLNVTLSDGSP